MKKNHFLITFLFCLCLLSGKAQYADILMNFSGLNGVCPRGSLVLSNGILYGTTEWGGRLGAGNIFSIDTDGNNYKDLFDIIGDPEGSLLIINGVLYGTAPEGWNDGFGPIFAIDTNGRNFRNLTDTFPQPNGPLTLYGSKLYVVSPVGIYGLGCIYSIDTSGGIYEDIHDFNDTLGVAPVGKLIASGNKLFGMTNGYYSYPQGQDGNIFSLDTDGNGFRILFSFNGPNGAGPYGSLLLSGPTLFGMTEYGGASDSGCIFSVDTDGTNYKDLFDFNGLNGALPMGDLVLKGNTLYGMTTFGGADHNGCVFSIDTDGTSYIRMMDFYGYNGQNPKEGGLTISGNTLYGMTFGGGIGAGVIFKINSNSIASVNKVAGHSELFKLFPNPNNGKFAIQCYERVEQNSEIKVYNVLGEEIYSTFLSTDNYTVDIDLSNQAPGLYIYHISNLNGKISEGKFVIQ